MGQTESQNFYSVLCDFIDEQIIKKHVVSNELPCYISGHHRLSAASLIPAKIHVLQTNCNTNVNLIPQYHVNSECNVGLLTVKQS